AGSSLRCATSFDSKSLDLGYFVCHTSRQTGVPEIFASLMSVLFQSAAPLELAQRLVRTRRDFLRSPTGLALGSTLLHMPLGRGAVPAKKRKVVVITFGGGARDQETFAPEGQDNIPNLMHELIPQSSFFTQVVNRGILGHYVATASLATG